MSKDQKKHESTIYVRKSLDEIDLYGCCAILEDLQVHIKSLGNSDKNFDLMFENKNGNNIYPRANDDYDDAFLLNNRYKNNLELIKDAFHRNKIQKEPTEAAEKKDYISEILEDLNEHSKKIEKIVLLKKKEEKRDVDELLKEFNKFKIKIENFQPLLIDYITKFKYLIDLVLKFKINTMDDVIDHFDLKLQKYAQKILIYDIYMKDTDQKSYFVEKINPFYFGARSNFCLRIKEEIRRLIFYHKFDFWEKKHFWEIQEDDKGLRPIKNLLQLYFDYFEKKLVIFDTSDQIEKSIALIYFCSVFLDNKKLREELDCLDLNNQLEKITRLNGNSENSVLFLLLSKKKTLNVQ